jgi:hypothetical protein
MLPIAARPVTLHGMPLPSIGEGEVYWDCRYPTVEEFVPNVIAGNRGFCNLNPYGPGPGAPAAVSKPHYQRHRA